MEYAGEKIDYAEMMARVPKYEAIKKDNYCFSIYENDEEHKVSNNLLPSLDSLVCF